MEWVWIIVASLVIGGWLLVAAFALLRGAVRDVERDSEPEDDESGLG
ncbi:MAG: hypothetical protein NT132_06215 [Microbacterium sp.]|nr:hypothetical protein [Microbacterium sp.]MCX6501987.1 hypothetical protein [Microbacterium sp.]